ncbi:aromatic amino acid aminotransferase [Sphingobium sp. TA15]|nr:aromatic amino acid aminotransferase [Sphingobium sp. TA15]
MRPPAPDSLMEVGRLFRADMRDEKIDLGVGTYRDGEGRIKIMAAVKQAEERQLKSQMGKGYLGPGGDQLYCERLMEALFPDLPAMADRRLSFVQTPGGTGAYRLGLELAAFRSPASRLIVGAPTWPNHIPVAERAGLRSVTYRHYDPATGTVDFDAMMEAVSDARPGDLFLLHGCCHNPTGAALSPAQWAELADALLEAKLLPLIDLAYAGMARGLVEDAAGTRRLLDRLPEAIIAISCSKSFGLYSERTGMLAVMAASPSAADACRLTAETFARSLWSNPPDHGAAIVRTILGDEGMRANWLAELDAMRHRLAGIRSRLAASGLPGTEPIAAQEGLFAMMPFDSGQIAAMREKHAVYMDMSGRINIAGLNAGNIDRFLHACRDMSHPANRRAEPNSSLRDVASTMQV